ncbi:hypothetical protein BDD12DRAFT_903837 [Trichophaea hybrida]|nr:hypothetical protein BDD12DRAFT_903837 [Trichophaea hybrida]
MNSSHTNYPMLLLSATKSTAVGDIGVSKVWWDVASDEFLCMILTEDSYPPPQQFIW